MGINLAIMELSSQIALLRAENERLSAELNSVKKNKRQRSVSSHPMLMKWKQRLACEKYDELMLLYADRIAAIQEVEPGWEPPKQFFDIEGRNTAR